MTTGTVCLPCWVAWNPEQQKYLRDHPRRTCRVRWVEDGEQRVCMCSCARASDDARPAEVSSTSDAASSQTGQQ